MPENPKQSLYLRTLCISFVALLVFALLFAILGFLILDRQSRVLYEEKTRVGKIAVDHFVNNALTLLLEDDTLSLSVLLKQGKAVPGLVYAFVSDENGIIRAHTDPARIGSVPEKASNSQGRTLEGDTVYETYATPRGERILAISRPVTFLKKTLAHVQAGFSLDRINTEIAKERAVAIRSITIVGLVMIAVFVLTIAILIFFVHRRLLERTGQRPLAAEDGTSDTVTSPPTLADSAALLTCSEETKRNQVSVLFVGIKGFKTYAENREPEALMEDLNEYLSIATSSVEEFGGFVDKLVGDGVISVFANSAVAADHAERAVGAALAMQRTFKEKGTTGNQLLLRAGIGISSGVVLSGCVGSGETKEIAYLGESFRTAYSLTVMAGPGEIILSKEAYRLLENTISVEPLPPREVLQRTQSWENFRLLEKL